MSCITRGILRWGVIGGLALGGATLLIGPERVSAGLAHVRAKAQNVIDNAVDDPVALRRQLEQLADEYPDRIAEVRAEIAEVDHQIGQFEHDIEVATRVVAMTSEDLGDLKTLVARAESEAAATARPVSIRHEGTRFNIDQAYSEGRRINNVRTAYADRLAHDQVQLQFLTEQQGRLKDILITLEEEYGTYQAQLWQLDRQIDAIQRNERLIKLTEQQQVTLSSYEKFGKVQNLKQLEAKLAELREWQRAKLEVLEKRSRNTDYEKRARGELSISGVSMDPFGDFVEIELGDEDEGDEDDEEADNTFAWSGPIVIEQQ